MTPFLFSYNLVKPCNCGSGNDRRELVDAKGIFCTFVCSECVEQKKARYRPEVFEDNQHWQDEDEDQ